MQAILTTTTWLLLDATLLFNMCGSLVPGLSIAFFKCKVECERDYDCPDQEYVCGNDGCCYTQEDLIQFSPIGGACKHWKECQKGVSCVGPAIDGPNDGETKCLRLGNEGDSCNDRRDCRAGLFCGSDSGSKQRNRRRKADPDEHIREKRQTNKSGSRRDRRRNRGKSGRYLRDPRNARSNDKTTSMTCQKLKQLGEQCTSSENCLSSHCLPAIFSTRKLLEERILIRGDLSQYRKYCVVKTVSKGQPCHPRREHCKTGENTICTLVPGFGPRFRGALQRFQRGVARQKRQAVLRRRPRRTKLTSSSHLISRQDSGRKPPISIPRGRFICRDTGVSLSSGKACNHYAHCPCGEACLGPAGNPITSNFPTASARWGTCTRVKCGKDKEGNNFECSHFGFDAKYVCSDEKACLPPQKALLEASNTGIQPSGGVGIGVGNNNLGSNNLGGNIFG